GDFIQAGIVYAQLAGNKTIPENYRDLAALYNTMMLQDDVAFLQRITTWTAPSSPYSAIAQFALADRLALSDPVRAITALDAILDNAEASSSLKQQAAALKDVLIR
nr:hypothetical protein [Alphaproteobacteria bacterium]